MHSLTDRLTQRSNFSVAAVGLGIVTNQVLIPAGENVFPVLESIILESSAVGGGTGSIIIGSSDGVTTKILLVRDGTKSLALSMFKAAGVMNGDIRITTTGTLNGINVYVDGEFLSADRNWVPAP